MYVLGWFDYRDVDFVGKVQVLKSISFVWFCNQTSWSFYDDKLVLKACPHMLRSDHRELGVEGKHQEQLVS